MKKGTKLCKYCKSEISAAAKICPNCRKKQSHIVRWIVIVIIGIFVLSVITSEVEVSDNGVENITSSPRMAKNSTQKKTSKTDFVIGETAEYNNVQMSVLSYEEFKGNELGTPEKGNVFVFANVEIRNNSDEEIVISSMGSFDIYCDDYKLDYSTNAFMAISSENRQELDGSIASSKKMNGWLAFEVPSEWKTIEINYKDNIFLESNFKFIISK